MTTAKDVVPESWVCRRCNRTLMPTEHRFCNPCFLLEQIRRVICEKLEADADAYMQPVKTLRASMETGDHMQATLSEAKAEALRLAAKQIRNSQEGKRTV